jgi:hypothetical protein
LRQGPQQPEAKQGSGDDGAIWKKSGQDKRAMVRVVPANERSDGMTSVFLMVGDQLGLDGES